MGETNEILLIKARLGYLGMQLRVYFKLVHTAFTETPSHTSKVLFLLSSSRSMREF